MDQASGSNLHAPVDRSSVDVRPQTHRDDLAVNSSRDKVDAGRYPDRVIDTDVVIPLVGMVAFPGTLAIRAVTGIHRADGYPIRTGRRFDPHTVWVAAFGRLAGRYLDQNPGSQLSVNGTIHTLNLEGLAGTQSSRPIEI